MPYKYIEVEKRLKKLGFLISRQNGSHFIFQKNNKIIVVPKHGNKDISPGVEKSIIKTLGITDLDFKII